MLGDSSVWLQVYTGLEMRTLTYSIDGDTLIGGIHYKISHYDAYFFLREDTITQQVFLKRADSLILPEKYYMISAKKSEILSIAIILIIDYFKITIV